MDVLVLTQPVLYSFKGSHSMRCGLGASGRDVDRHSVNLGLLNYTRRRTVRKRQREAYFEEGSTALMHAAAFDAGADARLQDAESSTANSGSNKSSLEQGNAGRRRRATLLVHAMASGAESLSELLIRALMLTLRKAVLRLCPCGAGGQHTATYSMAAYSNDLGLGRSRTSGASSC